MKKTSRYELYVKNHNSELCDLSQLTSYDCYKVVGSGSRYTTQKLLVCNSFLLG